MSFVESTDQAHTRSNHILQKLCSTARQMQNAIHDDNQRTVVICADQSSAEEFRESVLLFGGVLLLVHGTTASLLAATFKDHADQTICSTATGQGVTILDCWQALEHVRDIGWINWKDGLDDDDQPFLVDEFLHYADAANGGVHIVAPGQLLLFRDPVHLPDHQQWTVAVSDDDGSCSRRFSPAFYAELFADLGVAAVACLTESATSGAAFAARGIEVRDLRPGGSGGSVLRALDGLLSLSRGAAASGGVAVHGGGGAEWPADARVVLAAWLVGRAGFGERSAYAWLHMLCPWLP